MPTGHELREEFLKCFEEKGHLRRPGSSLIPSDPTTLFTSAGMQQFVPFWKGDADPPAPRLTTVQKCARAGDLETVGLTPRHLSFFEMLGNFSFGDYFKREAIEFAWEFLVERMHIDPAPFWVTIHPSDDEAAKLWMSLTSVPAGRIVKVESNWWGPVGATGPCGPCSEINYDLGPEFGCGKPDCKPECPNTDASGAPCGRFFELWNLVFPQFDRDADGKDNPLKRRGIDTGMGLERLALVMQKAPSVFDTDLFAPINDLTRDLLKAAKSGADVDGDPKARRAFRVIADHARAVTFLLADGVIPTNEGRGYALRRLIRRAYRFGTLLGIKEPFLYRYPERIAEHYGGFADYYNVRERREFAERLLHEEEKRFGKTIEAGEVRLRKVIQEHLASEEARIRANWDRLSKEYLDRFMEQALQVEGDKVQAYMDLTRDWVRKYHAGPRREGSVSRSTKSIRRVQEAKQTIEARMGEPQTLTLILEVPGEVAFELYDTYGFPVELTEEILHDAGLELFWFGFEASMREQRERARAHAARVFAYSDTKYYLQFFGKTEFCGYDVLSLKSAVIGVLRGGGETRDAKTGDEVEVVLDRSPFYGDSGGQIGDTGVLEGDGVTVRVTDTQHPLDGVTVHRGNVETGTLRVGQEVRAVVDADRRRGLMRAHTATHLLHWALRTKLGVHVAQAGSLVDNDRLRFDFSHFHGVTPDELDDLTLMISEHIVADHPVTATSLPYREAIVKGAMALFGEKYGDTVRMIAVGDISKELCGGTHCTASGQIGEFVFTGESGIGSGLRRVEALTGLAAVRYQLARAGRERLVAAQLAAPPEEVPERVAQLQAQLIESERAALAAEAKAASLAARALIDGATQVNGVRVVAGRVPSVSAEALRLVADELTRVVGSGVVVLASVTDGSVLFASGVSPDLVKRGVHAGTLIRGVAAVAGGGGGGRPELAQAGGKDPSRVDEALGKVPEFLKQQLK